MNDTTSCPDTYSPITAGNRILQMERIRSGDPETELKVLAFDFRSAHQHIGISAESDSVCRVAVLDPVNRLPFWCRMNCQPFGQRVYPR